MLHSLHKYTKIFDHILFLHIKKQLWLLRYANQNYFILYFFLSCPLMQRAAFFWAKTKPFFELTLIDNLIDNNCLLIFIPRFLIIFIGIKDAVFLFL